MLFILLLISTQLAPCSLHEEKWKDEDGDGFCSARTFRWWRVAGRRRERSKEKEVGTGREARSEIRGVLLLAWSFLAEAEARVPAGAMAASPTSNLRIAAWGYDQEFRSQPNFLPVAVLFTPGSHRSLTSR